MLSAVLGVLAVGGVTYIAVLANRQVDVSGCDPAHLECELVLEPEARALADGGLRRRYLTMELGGVVCDRDAGRDALVLRLPRLSDAGPAMRPVGPDSCRLLEPLGTCTDPTVCVSDDGGFNPPTVLAPYRCACRQADAGACVYPSLTDGGGLRQVLRGQSVPAPFAGAGCVRIPCVELGGEQGTTWPTASASQQGCDE